MPESKKKQYRPPARVALTYSKIYCHNCHNEVTQCDRCNYGFDDHDVILCVKHYDPDVDFHYHDHFCNQECRDKFSR